MLKKIKKLIPIILLIIAISLSGVLVFGVEDAEAETDLGIVDGLKTMLGGFLLMMQELIGSLVVWLAGLAQGILNFTNLQNTQMVKDGWGIVRDLVNMLFVLILMVIAFATILGVTTYGMKTLLPKLIIAALLINFSLVFCGVIIDFSGVLTNFFIEDSQDFFINIADQMQLTKIMVGTVQEPAESQWGCDWALLPDQVWSNQTACNIFCNVSTGNNCYEITAPKVDWGNIKGDLFWKVIAALFLSIIFTIIAAFVFAALAFLLLIRVLVIWFLLILAPIAWFFWILPATKNLWEKWWNSFIKWVFFAPAAIFFIWLSVNSWLKFIKGQAPKTGGEIIEGMSEVVTNDVLGTKIMPQVMAPENLVQFILACGMLIGSLIVAQKISIYGASGAINIAKGAGKGSAKWAGRRVQTATAERAGKIGRGIGNYGEKMGWVGKVTGAKWATKQIGRGPRAFEERERTAFAGAEKKYKDRTTKNLEQDYESANPQNKAAIGKILAGRKDGLKNFDDKKIKKMIELTKKYGQEKDVIVSRLDLAPIAKNIDPQDIKKVEEEINEAVGNIKTKDIEKIQIEAIGKPGEKSEGNQKMVFDAFKKQFKLGGKLGKSVLIKAGDENPVLYNRLMDDIIGKNMKDMKDEIREYYNTTTGKAVSKPKPESDKEWSEKHPL